MWVENFVAGAFYSRQLAMKNLMRLQPKYKTILGVKSVKSYDSYIYYVVDTCVNCHQHYDRSGRITRKRK